MGHHLMLRYSTAANWKEELRMEPWDYHHLKHFGPGGGGGGVDGRDRSTLLPVGGRCLCPYALAGQAIQQMTTDQRRENSQLQDIQGQEGG